MARTITWGDRQVAVARMALSHLSYATDTGAERGLIAGMLADLAAPEPEERGDEA